MAAENPWADLPKRRPYVLPMDRDAIAAHARSRRVANAPKKFGLHTELLPTPFVGNPKARVVILNLNPGFSEEDGADYAKPAFRKAAIENLTHEVDGPAFFPIDPRFRTTSLYEWWIKKLRWLIEAVGFEAVADGVFCVQAYPYHSREFAKGTDVPSQAYTRSILLERMRSKAFVVGMRAKRDWEAAVPELESYAAVHWLRNARNPTFSPGNLDCYDEVVSALRRRKR